MFLPLRQRRQLWRCDEDRVLAALGLIGFYEPGLLGPLSIHLYNTNGHVLLSHVGDDGDGEGGYLNKPGV